MGLVEGATKNHSARSAPVPTFLAPLQFGQDGADEADQCSLGAFAAFQ